MKTKLKRHRGNNIFGISTEFIKDPATFMSKYVNEFGSTFKLTMPLKQDFIITSDLNLVEHITIKNEVNYPKSKLHWQTLRKLLGRSVVTTESEEWKFFRKLLNPSFAKGQIENILHQNDQILTSKLDEFKGLEYPISITNYLNVIVIEVMLKAFLGVHTPIDYEYFAKILSESKSILMWRAKFPWRSYTGWLNGKNLKLYQNLNEFEQLSNLFISNSTSNDDNLIGRLLAEYQNNTITKKEIRNEILLNIGAGNEILASIIELSFISLSQHPDYLKRMEEEIYEVSNGNPIHYENLNQLSFTNQFIHEVIRYYSPSYSILRDCDKTDTFNNFQIHPNTTIFVSIHAIYHSEKYWDNPNIFFPDRFANVSNRHKLAFMPFGAGKHSCIAKYIAIPQLVMTLAFFVQNFEIEIINLEKLKIKTEIIRKPINLLYTLKNKNQKFNENTIS